MDPAALLVLVGLVPLLQSARALGSRLPVVLVAAPLVAGLAHAAYFVRVGGDFMHARMLLPSLFCLLLPVGVVVLRGWRWAGALLLVPWILICAVAIRHFGSATGVVNERDYYDKYSGQSNPVTIDDFYRAASPTLSWAREGRAARIRVQRGEHGLLLDPANPAVRPLPVRDQFVATPIVVLVKTLGVFGYAAGPDVFVVDTLGLATVIGSHFHPPPSLAAFGPGHDRAGHDKPYRAVWEVARFTPPAVPEPPDVRDARRSLRCGTVPELLDAVSGRFGPGRAWENLWDSFTLTRFRLPESPEKAVRELCG